MVAAADKHHLQFIDASMDHFAPWLSLKVNALWVGRDVCRRQTSPAHECTWHGDCGTPISACENGINP
ncbi:hypothetical protein C0J52_26320 [Blattella germanica]|nr:hypothetical protein C0J52_26320 [Blattella germanica]